MRRVGEPDLAAVGPIEARDQVQQRALAAAGFAGQRDALACRDAQVHPAQYGDVLAGGTIGLGQIANAQHDLFAGCHAKRVTMKIPLIVAQHTKTIAGDHGLKHDGDAIVIGSFVRDRSGGSLGAGAIQPNCPVALSDPPWVASGQADPTETSQES